MATLTEPELPSPEENRQRWKRWQEGLSVRITLPQELPPLRMLHVWDNLNGHLTPGFVLWLFAHGLMPLFTPLGGSYLDMVESVRRMLKQRALDGAHPQTPEEIIERLEATARPEPGPDAVCLGRQAQSPSAASTRAAPCPGRLRSVHAAVHIPRAGGVML